MGISDLETFNDDPWRWGRNGYVSQWGDYVACDSWECEAEIDPPMQVYQVHTGRVYNLDGCNTHRIRRPFEGVGARGNLKVEIRVWGRRTNGRLRATGWSAHLEYAGHRSAYASGSCTSVIDARRQCHAGLERDQIREFLREAISPDTANRIWRKGPDGELTPFMTTWTYGPKHGGLEPGEYLKVSRHGNEWRGRDISVSGYGWSSEGTEVDPLPMYEVDKEEVDRD